MLMFFIILTECTSVFRQLTKSSEIKAKKFQSNLGTSNSVDSSRLKKLASDVLAWTVDEMQLLMHGQLKVG